MCGIVGMLGHHEVGPILLEALKRLEYRGYDSAGIATVNHGHLDRRRAVGKLINLSDLLVHDPLRGKAGIGHTRWATHGAATVENAHPHRAGPVAVVHNGIIENWRDLRAGLGTEVRFESDTDTEIVAALVAAEMAKGAGPLDAVQAVLRRLEGAFALAFLFEGEEDLIIAARKGSPLAVGHGKGEMYLGSDAIALAPMTDRVTYLEEGDCAVIRRSGVEILDIAGRRANRPVTRIEVPAARLDKAGFRHFMVKEIHEQPAVIGAAINFYLSRDGARIEMPGDIDFTACDRVLLVACGTAHYACHVARYWFEQIAGLSCDIDIASEFRYREAVVSPRTVAIFVSQSGETADTLAALRHVRDQVAQVVAVVNVPTSTIAREADVALPIHAGAEIGVASTKAFACQLVVLHLLALAAAQARGVMGAGVVAERLADLRRLPGLMQAAIGRDHEVCAVAEEIAEARDVLFLGRGPMFPLALEGALKLKEISYIHAEGYASGELKHGPIALVDGAVPVVVLAPRDALFDKTVSNMQEVMARHGKVVLISDRAGLEEAGDGVWRGLAMPDVPAALAPILYAVPIQLLAYHAAVSKGTDVDQPRNLAKSVTVE